jgi:hypothetical protein
MPTKMKVILQSLREIRRLVLEEGQNGQINRAVTRSQ